MSLKDKLRSLIEATFTSKKAFIAEQALPASNYEGINVQLQNSDGWTYVPPADGYLKADIFSADQVFLHSGLLSYVDGGNRKGVFIPVRKGDGVSVGSANYQSGSNLTFFPLIGGGLKAFICGGGLCLLSHLSKRFSSSAAVKQCRQMNERHRRLPQTEIGYILLPLMMVISRFQHQATGETPIHLRLRTHQVKSYTECQQSLPRMLAHLSFVKKVTQSMFLSEEQQVLAGIPEPLSSLWGNRSFCKGGAL